MVAGQVERRLAAILAADVAGYSRLMGTDEVGTLAALKAHRREIVDPAIAAHRGRIVKTSGDGMLVEFPSVVDAVTCAILVQSKMAERNEIAEPKIWFRIGINVGDIIFDGGDIFGDGVNIAARVESECEPGTVCLSDDAFRQVRGKAKFAFDDLGEKSLKNIDRPVRIYAIRSQNSEAEATRTEAVVPKGAAASAPTLALPKKPSIAVLPFTNMSADAEQEYFADGLVEDIITALSQVSGLFVIARNSSFTYRGRAVHVTQVGRELGVRYVLEGSVRRAGHRLRITGQLIDASNGAHVWADRFEGALDEIFDFQDQVTESVVGVIAPTLERAEIDRSKRKLTESLDAYDYYLRGLASFNEQTKDTLNEARRLFGRAIDADTDFGPPYAAAVRCIGWQKASRWMKSNDIAEAERLVRRAVQLCKEDPVSLSRAGYGLAYVVGDLDRGAALIDRALSMTPNLSDAWRSSAWVRVWLGEPDVAIDNFARAMRLNPRDPLFYSLESGTAFAHFFAGRYEEASSWAARSLRNQTSGLPHHQALRMAAASNALAGRLDEAQKAMRLLRRRDPALRISNLRELTPLRREQDIARYEEALRLAGLPS